MPLTSPATPPATPLEGVVDAIAAVVLGRRPQIELCVAAAVTGNHVLLDDEPGVGKTTLAKALAITLGGSFARIQGTVDLLPGDLTGVTVVDPATGVWSLRPGPLLNDVVLVDEVNRISPRTQSALLEAMAERQVTIDGTTHPLSPHFVTIATMNPRGSNGTFVLTEGQVDRFGVVVSLGGADSTDELELLRGRGGAAALDDLF